MDESLTGLFDFTSIVGRWVTGLQDFWNLLNTPVVDVLNIRWLWFFATEQVKMEIGQTSLLDFILYASLGLVIVSFLIRFIFSFTRAQYM